MERDYGKEIDALWQEIKALKGTDARGRNWEKWLPESPDPTRNIYPMPNADPDERLSSIMMELCEKAEARGDTGAVTYLGVFASGERQSNWIRKEVSTDGLLSLIETEVAFKALACIGSSDRLRMLLALLRAPRTVAQLVESCGFSSTGQAYHHLRPLLAADLVKEDEHTRGMYLVIPHRVQGIIMVLAGISDLLDATYTQGIWSEET
ncbi:MAG: helix-turn-helix domain-containing protein [Christensenellales bacterium]